MRYRNLPLFFLASLILMACDDGQTKFSVVGDVSDMPEQTIYLERLDVVNINTTPEMIDSTKSTKNGHFELKGKLTEPGIYLLRPEIQSSTNEPDKMILLSIDGGNIKVNADWKTMRLFDVKGSSPSSSLKNFLQIWREHIRDLNTIGMILQNPQTNSNDSVVQKAITQQASIRSSFVRYIEEYADTTKYLPNAIFAVQVLNVPVEKEFLSTFVSNLEARFPNNPMVEAYKERYNKKLSELQQQQDVINNSPVGIGKQAPEITLPDPSGKEVSLSSFKGKYVLVDFWASWCKPCRQENPNVVKAYNQYKGKSFTVLGVSLDESKEKWEQAIKDDGLIWTHISDLNGWQSVVVRTYMIQGIPANVLLDPDGKIIGRNLRGPDLIKKLEETL